MPWRTTVVAFLCVTGPATSLVTPVTAHHSHANYDITTWTVLEGTVKQLVLMAPLSIVYLDVKDGKGAVVTWALEATNQRTILNNGVKRENVRPGDQIKVRCVTCFATAPRGACSASRRPCTAMRGAATRRAGMGLNGSPHFRRAAGRLFSPQTNSMSSSSGIRRWCTVNENDLVKVFGSSTVICISSVP